MPKTPQENPSSTMPDTSETSKEKPTDMAESSKASQTTISQPSTENSMAAENENPTYSFNCKMNKTDKLKIALEALSDPELNPDGLGRIDVDEECFEITVRNGHVICHLRLNSAGMIKFECRNPVKNKMVNLKQIFEFLADAAKDDVVTVSLLDDASQLSFKYGKASAASAREFSAQLSEADPQYEKCPDTELQAEVVLLTQDLRGMIAVMKKEKPQDVAFEIKITHECAVLSVGGNDCYYDSDDEVGGIRGLKPGDYAYGLFYYTYTDSLKVASNLAAKYLISIVQNPYDSVKLRFNLRELGELVYLVAC